MTRKKGSLNNVVPIDISKRKIEVKFHCSLCKADFNELIRWNMDTDKLRCPKCVNPVEMVYPKETE